MKIGYDAKRAFFNFRGLGNYCRTLIESFSKYYSDESYYLYTPAYKKKEAYEFDELIKTGPVKVCTPRKIFSKAFPSWWRSLFLSKRVALDQLDIYHGLSHELPLGIDKLKVKSVVTIHDLIFLRYPQFFSFIDRMIYKRKFLYSTKVADKIVAICEQTKNDLVDFLHVEPSKIEVVYQSCDPQFYIQRTEKELEDIAQKYQLKSKGFFLNVGALEERKNTLNLVKAFNLIKDKTCCDLVLVGRGKSYRKEIEYYILEQNLSARVRILSNISHCELPHLYQLAKITIYPSLFEGFGIPIIESLFAHTPVITSKGSCFPEAGGPGAIYIDPLNIDELAENILLLDGDTKLLEKLSIEGRKYVEKFHWKNTSKAMHDLYVKLLRV